MTDSFLRVTHTIGRNGEQMSAEGGTKAIVAALLANTGIAVSKFVAAGITGSASMLAEGVHSVADASNQVLLLIGGKASRKAASPAPAGLRCPPARSGSFPGRPPDPV